MLRDLQASDNSITRSGESLGMGHGFGVVCSYAMRVARVFFAGLLIVTLTSCGSGYRPEFPFSSSLNSTSVFMGDSITEGWPLPDHNKGIFGQTTAQMLARFNTDVIGHGYERVVILGGTNDINIPQINVMDVYTNLDAMATMAESAGMEVVLCKVPPRFPAMYDDRYTSVNEEITSLAQSKHLLLVDYFTVLTGHPEFFKDGVHPNQMGYAVMENTLSQVVVK
jgi:lysophospholipase L1-like esterase